MWFLTYAKKYWLVCLLAAPLAWLAWEKYAPRHPNFTTVQGPVVTAQTPPKVIERVKTVTLPGPERIVYLDKPSLSAILKMPEISFSDSANPVAVTEVAPHTGKTTVVAMLDNTGKTSLLTRQEPTKFLEFRRQIEIRGRYLFTGTNLMEADLVAKPLRIGPVEVEGGAGLEVRREDSSLGFRTFVGATYRF